VRVATDHREAILQAAASLFARKKFHEVLMDDVAEKTGIAKGTIYRFYSNKEELFAALSMRYMEILGTESAAIASGDGLPLERLGAIVKRLAELVFEHNDFFQVMMRHECELVLHRQNEMTARRQAIRDSIVTCLKQAQQRKEISFPYPLESAADMLLGMMRNLNRFTTPRPSPEQVSAMALQLFLKGVSTPRNRGAA
jgi:AcrR family transcriptional regulator